MHLLDTHLHLIHRDRFRYDWTAEVPPLAKGRTARLMLGDRHLGYLGELDAGASKQFQLRGASASAAELDLNTLMELADLSPTYQRVPQVPPVSRDLSLVVDRNQPWAEIEDVVRQAGGSALESVTFLDTFEGGDIPDGRHSLHFGLTFRRPDRTLTGEEVDQAIQAIIDACRSQFDAVLRA